MYVVKMYGHLREQTIPIGMRVCMCYIAYMKVRVHTRVSTDALCIFLTPFSAEALRDVHCGHRPKSKGNTKQQTQLWGPMQTLSFGSWRCCWVRGHGGFMRVKGTELFNAQTLRQVGCDFRGFGVGALHTAI